MAKTKKLPKMSDQAFTKMVEALLGAKVHLDYAEKHASKPSKKRQHLYQGWEYLEIVETRLAALSFDVSDALKKLQGWDEEARKKKAGKMVILD
jgi:hypothetical protein